MEIRDFFQYDVGKKSRFSSEFQGRCAQIIIDKEDMAQLKMNWGQNVWFENDVGKVVVTARRTEDESHPGLGFMTNRLWSNQLVRVDSVGCLIPEFKAIKVRVSGSNKGVTKLSELLERMRR